MNYYSMGILDTFQPEKKVHKHTHPLPVSQTLVGDQQLLQLEHLFDVTALFFLHSQEFQMPHDIVKSIDDVYVGDLDSRQIYKFTLESKLMCVTG